MEPLQPVGFGQLPQIDVEVSKASGVNLSTEAIKKVDANGQNIIKAIDYELQLAGVGPYDTVECNGMCERENPEDLKSPFKIGAYYNEDKGKAFYEAAIVWEIKITKQDGTVQRINVHQDRVSTLEVPKVNETMRHTDTAYIVFILGTEYAKTISAIYDTQNPEYAQMQGAKEKLRADDTLYITIKRNWFYQWAHTIGGDFHPDDPSVYFKGYGSSSVQWLGDTGEKVKIIDRNFSKETYKVDRTSNRYFRTMKNQQPEDAELTDGIDFYMYERTKLDKKSGWFKKLIELEEVSRDNIVHELQKYNIPEQDWATRISDIAPKIYGNSMQNFNYPPEQLPEFANEINKLKGDPSQKDTLKHLQEKYNELPAKIKEIRILEGQLEELESRGAKVETHRWRQWPSAMIKEKADHMQTVYDSLNGALGSGPNTAVQ
jgi:hypothetical protein